MKPGWVVKGITAFGATLLTVPTLVLVAVSVGPGANIQFPPRGVTAHWYVQLATDGTLRVALGHSLYVGIESVILALVIGVPAIFGLHRHRIRFKPLLDVILALGFTVPLIVSGISFLVLFTQFGIINELWAVGLAVTVINFPFLLWAGAAAIAAHNPELEEAAETLGAEEIQRTLFVTLPSLAPGILTGTLLVFVFGITEFLVSLMLVNVHTLTLPVYVFSSIRQNVSPELAAVSVLYVVIAAGILAVTLRVGRLGDFLYREQHD
jgi:putative spermidine/putrescine transport system permease protein